jgi:hypothetical protein
VAEKTIKIKKAVLVQKDIQLHDYKASALSAKEIKIPLKSIKTNLHNNSIVFFIENAGDLICKDSILQKHMQHHVTTIYAGEGDDFMYDYRRKNKSELIIDIVVKDGKESKPYKLHKTSVINPVAVKAKTLYSKIELHYNDSLLGNNGNISNSRKVKANKQENTGISFTLPIKETIETIKMRSKVNTLDKVKDKMGTLLVKYYKESDSKLKQTLEFDNAHYAKILERKAMGRNPINMDQALYNIKDHLCHEVEKMVDNCTSSIRAHHIGKDSSQTIQANAIYDLITRHPNTTEIVMNVNGPMIVKQDSYTSRDKKEFTVEVSMTKVINIRNLLTALSHNDHLAESSKNSLNRRACKDWYRRLTMSAVKRSFSLSCYGNIIDGLHISMLDSNCSYKVVNKTEVTFDVSNTRSNSETRETS